MFGCQSSLVASILIKTDGQAEALFSDLNYDGHSSGSFLSGLRPLANVMSGRHICFCQHRLQTSPSTIKAEAFTWYNTVDSLN